ncbi:DsbE family thiol:disulfide interchange protein [Congregibacter brevis]|uniref:DsbE family thiol:disulfide interchange protein n=1 Tax=Congregibacter brevis TaxID=3081201 RepID=A0ABZ0I945_9GAMM|nr:DsbE family thiol:disulfide interchange protein [Congregibacter sp. IMCC45268]
MSSRLKLFVPLGLFLLLAVLLFRGLSLDPQALPSALIDKPLPEFTLPALSDEQTLTDSDLLGAPLLLNVWATWCISCRVEHPYLQRLADKGVLIYGVNYKDDSTAARGWLEQLGDPYQESIVDAQGTFGLDLGVYGAPETYFVDAKGVIRYRHVGVIDERVWTGRLKAIYDALATPSDS